MTNIIKQIRTVSKRVFYGWWVVADASFLYALGIGSVFYGFSTYFVPFMNEFGWSRAAISGVKSLSRLEGGIEGPVVGWAIDKFGARKLAIIGVSIAAVGFFALTLVTSNIITLYLIFGLLLALGYNTGFARPADAVAAKWFIKKRSRALSFVTAGAGLGGIVFIPLQAWLITQYGWRSTVVVMGLIFLIFGLPAAFFLRSRPEDMGLLPDGEAVAQPTETTPKAQLDELAGQPLVTDASPGEIDFTVKEAMKTRAFWTLVGAMMLRACSLSALVIHQIPHLVDIGIEYQTAAAALALMVLMSLPGRLIFGWLGDILDKRRLMLICCLLQAIGIWIFINATTLGMVYVFVVIFGVGYGGAIPLTLGFRADLFGSKIFASMMGITSALTMITTVAAPVLLGLLYDVTQSYTIGFYALLGTILLSGVIFLLIRKPKPPARLTGLTDQTK